MPLLSCVLFVFTSCFIWWAQSQEALTFALWIFSATTSLETVWNFKINGVSSKLFCSTKEWGAPPSPPHLKIAKHSSLFLGYLGGYRRWLLWKWHAGLFWHDQFTMVTWRGNAAETLYASNPGAGGGKFHPQPAHLCQVKAPTSWGPSVHNPTQFLHLKANSLCFLFFCFSQG